MALCTICLADPCPHLMMRGGTAGAPLVAVGIAAKYAPSSKPHCPSCDRVHRNIGMDNQPVCAWRTYSRASGVDFQAFTPENVEEFASWFKSGAWSAPIRSRKAPAKTTPGSSPTPPAGTGVSAAASSTSGPPLPPSTPTTITVPVIEDEDPTILAEPASIDADLRTDVTVIKSGPPLGERDRSEHHDDDIMFEIDRAEEIKATSRPPTPKKAPAFSKGKLIKDEQKLKKAEVPV